MSGLRDELSALLGGRVESLRSAVKAKGANDRVDALVRFCRDLLRASSLCLIGGVPHYYDGRVYARVSWEGLRLALGNLLMDADVSPTDVRKMGDIPLSVVSERVVEPGPYLAFTNGVFDLAGGSFLPFGAERVVVRFLPYPFDARARCPKFNCFLNEILPDGAEQTAMMEFFSLCLVDRSRVSVEKMALLVGEGSNGKSVLFDVIKAVLGGSDAVSTLDPSQLADEKMLPYVDGKLLNFSPDVRRSSAFESALKALCSAQGVTARRIFCDAQTVVAPPLAFALNEMPYFRDRTHAFFRRLLLIPFDVTIPEERQDKTLAATLIAEELPGIFQMLLRRRESLRERGYEFVCSQKMTDRLAALRVEARSDVAPVRGWLTSRGLSPFPSFPDQPFVVVSQADILEDLGGSLSAAAVSREMRSYGIEARRGREARYYRVYPIVKEQKI